MTDQPITVTEAIAALEREIEEGKTADRESWPDPTGHRDRYRAALEYLYAELKPHFPGLTVTIPPHDKLYAAVAPIVARWQAEGKL